MKPMIDVLAAVKKKERYERKRAAISAGIEDVFRFVGYITGIILLTCVSTSMIIITFDTFFGG